MLASNPRQTAFDRDCRPLQGLECPASSNHSPLMPASLMMGAAVTVTGPTAKHRHFREVIRGTANLWPDRMSPFGPKRRKRMSAPMSVIGVLSGLVLRSAGRPARSRGCKSLAMKV